MISNISNRTSWTRKDIGCQLLSAFVTGFLLSLSIVPIDTIRTHIMVNNKIYFFFLYNQ